jgi:energy-converting hydrogenase A subunit M
VFKNRVLRRIFDSVCSFVWMSNLVSDINVRTHRLWVFENRVLRRIFDSVCSFVWMSNFVSDINVRTHRLWVFENRVLRGIFGPKRDEVISSRNMRSETHSKLYFSSNKIRMIKST